jgi:DNA polymerase III gamma/tau subunit
VFEENVQTLIEACAKLWEEKEDWRKMYHDMVDRYNKHLDQDIETYNKMLGHRR